MAKVSPSNGPPAYDAAMGGPAPGPNSARGLAHWHGGSHFPEGLRNQFVRSAEEFDHRFWIVDNSGSMRSTDGTRVHRKRGGEEVAIKSSRWEELCQGISFHGECATALRAPTEFTLLNQAESMQTIVCGMPGQDVAGELAELKRFVATEPTGTTPLCGAIRAVVAKIRDMAPSLRARQKKVVLVIASDGEATDGRVQDCMAPLKGLPVWVVVRLCTSEDSVVDYWNQIDNDLELDMDVLDDVKAEAKEVAAFNPWVTYAPPLHRLREWGTSVKVFDSLEEGKLSGSQMQKVCELILGDVAGDCPSPELEWGAFRAFITDVQKNMAPVFDPTTGRRKPWITVKKRSIKSQKQSAACCIL